MSNSLVPLDSLDLVPFDAKELTDLTGGGTYLPRIQLIAATSELSDKFNPGTFVMTRGKDNHVDLGKSFRAAAVLYQGKAAYLVKGQAPDVSIDIHSEKFAKFKQLAKGKTPGYMFGPEFLIWLHSLDEPCFTTFFCSSYTAQQAAAPLIDIVNKAVKGEGGFGFTVSSKRKSNAKGSWFAPDFIPDNTPIANMPSPEEWEDAKAKFKSVSGPAKPKLEEATGEEDRPR
jgi:hypothetical protein